MLNHQLVKKKGVQTKGTVVYVPAAAGGCLGKGVCKGERGGKAVYAFLQLVLPSLLDGGLVVL